MAMRVLSSGATFSFSFFWVLVSKPPLGNVAFLPVWFSAKHAFPAAPGKVFQIMRHGDFQGKSF